MTSRVTRRIPISKIYGTTTTARQRGQRTLDLLILSRLARGAMHGFGIAEYLHMVSDAPHVEEGPLYPALHRLESLGLIESTWGVSENNRRARFYKLTPRGRKQVTVEISNWRRMVEAVNV